MSSVGQPKAEGMGLPCVVKFVRRDVHGRCAICSAYKVSAVSGRSPEAIKL